MIGIGMVTGGPEIVRSAVYQVIFKLMQLTDGHQADTGIDLEVVYEVPGSVYQADFEGAKVVAVFRKRGMIQVKIAVPADLVARDDRDECFAFGFRALREAIEVAAARLKTQDFKADSARACVDGMERALVH